MSTATHSDTAVVTLPSETQVQITREFAAPRHNVFRAWTEPDLVRRWWHAERGTIVSVESDPRPGGVWRYVMTANAGFEVAFHGQYQEVVPDELLVSTEVYEAVPDAYAINTAEFTEQDGRTKAVLTIDHLSRENRDMQVQSGMEEGLQTAFNLLEKVAADLA